jgi:hypothetical protein
MVHPRLSRRASNLSRARCTSPGSEPPFISQAVQPSGDCGVRQHSGLAADRPQRRAAGQGVGYLFGDLASVHARLLSRARSGPLAPSLAPSSRGSSDQLLAVSIRHALIGARMGRRVATDATPAAGHVAFAPPRLSAATRAEVAGGRHDGWIRPAFGPLLRRAIRPADHSWRACACFMASVSARRSSSSPASPVFGAAAAGPTPTNPSTGDLVCRDLPAMTPVNARTLREPSLGRARR